MTARAVHFAITEEEAFRLMETPGANDEFILECVQEIEERWDTQWLQQTDKSWDAIHRCMTDGKLEYGDTVFHKVILGNDNLYEGDDWIISFLAPEEVKEVAEAIKGIDQEWMRQKYYAIDTKTYPYLSEDDFEYTWSWFLQLQAFFQKAAAEGRSMIFSVDQ